MTERDPRIDPQPGDIFRHPLCKRVTVLSRSCERLSYEVWETAYEAALPQWREWAKGAEVIHVASTKEPERATHD